MSRKILIPIVFLAMVLGVFSSAAGVPSRTLKADQALVEYAGAHPDGSVRVIAFRSHLKGDIADLVRSLGGAVVHDLDMIQAVAAEVPATAVSELTGSQLVRWVSLDGPVESSNKSGPSSPPVQNPSNYYLDTLNVRPVWNMGLRGEGIAIAVIDSGVHFAKDLQVDPSKAKPDSRVLQQLAFSGNTNTSGDIYGHGTLVAGIAAGSGYVSNYLYTGVAPNANIIGLRVSDDAGMSYESDVVAAMQWVFNNKATYNIRVVNMSLNTSTESSYHTSPISAAAEILWFNGVVVVASAGNSGISPLYNTVRAAPANDPFIITVGATDEKGNATRSDDVMATFSAFGTTVDGFAKPDILAPGRNIVSILSTSASGWKSTYPDRVVMNGEYFRASGTSLSAPMVSGAAALLLQDEPNLTPDQVKFRLLNTGTTVGGYKYLDVYAAVTGTTTKSANTKLTASQLLWTGSSPVTWNSVSWNSVSWNSVSWNSVSWNSVSWNSVSWNSVFLGP